VLLLNSASDIASVKFFLCVAIYQLITMICSAPYILFSIGNAFLGFVSLTKYITFVAVIFMYEFLYLHVFPCSLCPAELKVSCFVCVFGTSTQ